MADEIATQVRIAQLEKENESLRKEIEILKRENESLKEREALGRTGEDVVAALTGGVKAGYQHPYDLTLPDGIRLEVKTSRLDPTSSKTKRWHWGSVLGRQNKGGDYDFLVLLGEKDARYEGQYPPGSLPYVFFLVPRSDVPKLSSGTASSMIAINTNFATANAPKSKALMNYLVSEADIGSLASRLNG
jgi:hypothetical protein